MSKQVVTEGYAALGTNDFAPYIQQFASSGAEGIWVALAGRDAINFAQQAAQFGLLKKLNVAGVSFVTDNTVATLGEVSRGIWSIINRSEEHTSELQSLMRISYAVFCLKKKINTHTTNNKPHIIHT